jgi:hypothetical protein
MGHTASMTRLFSLLAMCSVLVVTTHARADEVAERSGTERGASEEVTVTSQTEAQPAATQAVPLPPVEASVAEPSVDAEAEEDAQIAAGLAERARLRPWHILFGNLTWAASNVATILGFVTFSDRYGWSGNPESAGCAGPSPIFGDTCGRGTIPVAHVVAVSALTLFYGSTFTIGAVMPDPLGVGEGPSARSAEINVHRALRWSSLAIMALQILLGAISQNVEFNDFGADRAMAATHLALGTLSWGVLTAQGVVGSLLAY